MKRGVLVLGAGGHASVVVATLQDLGEPIAGVLDDEAELWGSSLLGVEVAGPITGSVTADDSAVLAFGTNRLRQRLASELPCGWQPVVHPRAYVHRTARICDGAFIAAGAVIQPNVVIGAHAVINTGATVDHDCIIGPCAHVAPGAHLAGEISVGEGALIGIGASVTPGLRIGDWSVLGAGAVAVRDIEAGVQAVGVPARPRHCG